MHVCELIPLKTSKKIEFLTYYSSLIINSGDLVLIDMHGQKLNAIVYSSTLLRESKLDIKSKNFKIKKIESLITPSYISKDMLPSLYDIATNLGTSINNILSTLISLERLTKIKFEKRKITKSEIDFKFSSDFDINSIKENEFVVVPTKLLAAKNIMVSTPSFNFLINTKINHIYLTHECSSYYFRFWKGLDTKLALTLICELLHIDVTYVDNYPSLNTYANLNESEQNEIDSKIKNFNNKKITIIKMNSDNNKSSNPYIHQDLKIKLIKANKESKKIIIYNLKKGYASNSICNDCNNYVSCEVCNSPYGLTEKIIGENLTRYHECSKCDIRLELDKIILCKKCGSHNINTLGLGTESVRSYLRDKLKLSGEIIDSEHSKNPPSSRTRRYRTTEGRSKILEKWRTSGGIIIGTDLLLNNLNSSEADLIIITSLDALFYIKNYMIDELLFYKFNNIKSKLSEVGEIYLETRRETSELLKLSPLNFYQSELLARKNNNLPPYYQIITFISKSAELNIEFLNNYKRLIYKNDNKYKYIYFVGSQEWQSNNELRSMVCESLKSLNLEVNPHKVLD